MHVGTSINLNMLRPHKESGGYCGERPSLETGSLRSGVRNLDVAEQESDDRGGKSLKSHDQLIRHLSRPSGRARPPPGSPRCPTSRTPTAGRPSTSTTTPPSRRRRTPRQESIFAKASYGKPHSAAARYEEPAIFFNYCSTQRRMAGPYCTSAKVPGNFLFIWPQPKITIFTQNHSLAPAGRPSS